MTDNVLTSPPLIRLARSDVGEEEIELIREVLASGILTNGPFTRQFEELFAARHDVEHAVAFANGTVALAAMFLAYGIGPGDEVIVPSLTFISTATSVLHVGATPIFADVEPDTFTLDANDVRGRITPRTRAILAVHYAGQPADLDALQAVADEAGVLLLEDAAQAHGSAYRGRPVGGIGAAGMFSFTATKNITTGEGGLVTTNDGAVAERMRLLRNHGQAALYHHVVVGYNWRLSEMQAAMGVVQMGRLDGIIQRKRANAKSLSERLQGLPGVGLPVARPDREHVYMLYTVTLNHGRDQVLQQLLDDAVEARVYFPPAHRQEVFAASAQPSLPVTEDLAGRIVSLPFHSRLTSEEFQRIDDSLRAGLASRTD